MNNNVKKELQEMKYLFSYRAGRVISEQEEKPVDEDFEMGDTTVKPLVKPDVDTPTKPKKPGTPYSPKPGPKKAPKAKKKDIPDWLSFDELGIEMGE